MGMGSNCKHAATSISWCIIHTERCNNRGAIIHEINDTVTGDTPFTRRLYIELTPDEQAAFIESVRTRRLVSVTKYQDAIAIRQRAKDERTLATLDKESSMMEKELVALEKALAKVEARAVKISAISLIIESMRSNEDE
jgi:hypothetical protein